MNVKPDKLRCQKTAERPPKDRRGITNLWIENQQLAVCMTRLRNALVFRKYVVATKKAQRTHIEGLKKGYHQGTAKRSLKDCQQIVLRYLCRRRCLICATIRRNTTIVRKQKTYKLWQRRCHNSDATLLLQIKH